MLYSATARKTSSERIRVNSLIAKEHLPLVKRFCAALKATDQSFFLADQVERQVEEFLETCEMESCEDLSRRSANALKRLFRGCQEIVLDADYTYALLRPKVGIKAFARIHPESEALEYVNRLDYLQVKDAYVQGHEEASLKGLVLDFSPFFHKFPKVREASEMGEGISFLNRHLSGQMYQNPEVFKRALLQFLQDIDLDGLNVFVNEHLTSPDVFLEELDSARNILSEHHPQENYQEIAHDLRVHGFEAGWGGTVREINESLSRLARLLESPDPTRFEHFLGRLPLVRTVLMVSPHGWFAQDDVLGKPDTGGQVTYVLDQVRAIERALRNQFQRSGIDIEPRVVILTRLIPNAEGTSCNLPTEMVHGSKNSWIVRVPFRDNSGEIIPEWISRFKIWPYLETFAEESKAVVVNELQGRPDLIIGHYSDGNLVAHRLADDLETTHCAAVHALEKTKYLLSDMYWADMEHDYRFSLQFTADLIAYNSSDFIISSSYREIAGSDTEMGMFESYQTFSMPGLYRVVSGMDPQLARHNIVPPGASNEYFFPHTETERRVEALTDQMITRFFQKNPGHDAVGTLNDPDKPSIFAMARIDKIKNLSGLVEIYAHSGELKESANLFIVSSLIDAAKSEDQEEIEEIHRIYHLIEQHGLDGKIRWCAARLNKVETGEIYRIVADRKGVFAQPALMETFGLTVVEAMACGLPVVVTCFGGPSEIVVPGSCGEVENPNQHGAFAGALQRILSQEDVWEKYSINGIKRSNENFSWVTHAQRILKMTNVYSYWNYLDVMNRSALDQYIHTLYHTVYRPRAQSMLEEELSHVHSDD